MWYLHFLFLGFTSVCGIPASLSDAMLFLSFPGVSGHSVGVWLFCFHSPPIGSFPSWLIFSALTLSHGAILSLSLTLSCSFNALIDLLRLLLFLCLSFFPHLLTAFLPVVLLLRYSLPLQNLRHLFGAWTTSAMARASLLALLTCSHRPRFVTLRFCWLILWGQVFLQERLFARSLASRHAACHNGRSCSSTTLYGTFHTCARFYRPLLLASAAVIVFPTIVLLWSIFCTPLKSRHSAVLLSVLHAFGASSSSLLLPVRTRPSIVSAVHPFPTAFSTMPSLSCFVAITLLCQSHRRKSWLFNCLPPSGYKRVLRSTHILCSVVHAFLTTFSAFLYNLLFFCSLGVCVPSV